jgi:DNA invertase Pin-like site-specific DNA recombinase
MSVVGQRGCRRLTRDQSDGTGLMTKILDRPAAAEAPAVATCAGQQGRSIGYARVSTRSQTTAPQEADLQAAGCELVFAERVSTRTADTDRTQLQRCLAELRPGDELVVVKLDRLGRTQREVIERLATLQDQGIHVRTLDGLVNTKALGKMAPLVVGLLTGLAEVERSLIRERTVASVEHRRATGGDLGGRPRSFTPEQAEQVQRLAAEGMSIAAIARATGLSETTCRRLRGAGA